MKNKYRDLIDQTFDFPQDEFRTEDGELYYHDIPLMEVIKQYGTPLKITYLPKISSQIQRAKRLFNVAIAKTDYQGTYNYCYCTKSSHFEFVLREALKNDINLETSSAFDINLIQELHNQGLIDKDKVIVCNGFKKDIYIDNIISIFNDGFRNVIPILDNKNEYYTLDRMLTDGSEPMNLGIRIASEEEPKFDFYTSRLGIRYNDIVSFFEEQIKPNPKFRFRMLHFFINTGIRDTAYYWNELAKCVNVYCDLKRVCPELDSLNIGGGFPSKVSLAANFDYEYMAEEILAQIKNICTQRGVEEPNIFTEFGSFTVGESGATLYSILDQKQQNDRELWYMIDSSFIQRVFLGGLTCDSEDFYNADSHANAIFLPKLQKDDPLYIGFFHTGAYQESIGGYGGIQHCLIPAPKHVIIDKDENGEYTTKLFAKEQSYKSMLKILGY